MRKIISKKYWYTFLTYLPIPTIYLYYKKSVDRIQFIIKMLIPMKQVTTNPYFFR